MAGKRTLAGLAVILMALLANVASAQIRGDINDNGVLDASDLGLCVVNTPEFPWWVCDFNDDGMITFEDRLVWIHELRGTWIGDANLDGEFNGGDMVQVFVGGKYETDWLAGWEEGDWNGDGIFDSGDLVTAFVDGGYEQGSRTDAVAVPEPGGWVVVAMGLLPWLFDRRARHPI